MRQYVIDELRPEDHKKLKRHLDERFGRSGIEGVYWIPIETDVLTDEQLGHTDCHPLCFAIDLEPGKFTGELLVRTRNRIRCSCIDYATEAQRNRIIRFIDTIFEELDITT